MYKKTQIKTAHSRSVHNGKKKNSKQLQSQSTNVPILLCIQNKKYYTWKEITTGIANTDASQKEKYRLK